MIFHFRIDDGIIVPVEEALDWADWVIDEYFELASVLEEGVHDVTPRALKGTESRHRVQVFSDGTAAHGVYRGEELQESFDLLSESHPTLLISLTTRTPELIFVLGIVFYYPDLFDLEPDVSFISKN